MGAALAVAALVCVAVPARSFGEPRIPIETDGPVQTESAYLHGLVEPNGEEVIHCAFEVGTTTSYGMTAECQPSLLFVTTGAPEVSAYITGLTPNTTYHYRIYAFTEFGMGWGPDENFTTNAAPAPAPTPAPAPAPTPTPALAPALTAAPIPAPCKVPSLKGRTLARAKQMLSNAQCKLGTVRRLHGARGQLVVAKQSPAAGTNTVAGTAVRVLLASRQHPRHG